MSNPGEVTLCPTAPLTNIAMAMLKEPRLRDNVKDIVLMGGAAFRQEISRLPLNLISMLTRMRHISFLTARRILPCWGWM